MIKTGVFSGREVYEYTLTNTIGMKITVLNYGGTITGIYVPLSGGGTKNIVLKYDDYDEYEINPYYFGCIIGRTAGRISGGSFTAGAETYSVLQNEGVNHLHGGIKGFAHTFFEVEQKENSLILTCVSPDGEDGYPGNVKLEVTYTLTAENELLINYKAVTDKITPLNLTNHTYFLLEDESVENHRLFLNSSAFYSLDEASLPKRLIDVVKGNLFDFKKGRYLQEVFTSNDPHTEAAGGGLDHPFLLDSGNPAGEIVHPESGRKVIIETDQPAAVIYTGNFIADSVSVNGKPGKGYGGICFETQEVPDRVESILVSPEKIYRQRTVFRFSF
ncbi:aldose epimerase family protein [Alkalicoccus saliphilus]|uniref:Aldose 1-epimerase n=1 Tax=Alkalicoccus saliphilus TaxID=200989 RepID=A0A2T4U6I9_9BACI|nr:aldose epimerase family protein [Alkalicoccus saliphilus]PTL39013.1 galactose-1-epimerase [Alkalicoccus saliphilus]